MAEEKKTTKKSTTTKAGEKKAPAKKATTAKKPAAKKATATKKTTPSKTKESSAKGTDLTKKIKAASEKKSSEAPAKKSLDDIIKHDQEVVKSDKPLDHVEVLRKKMEAQKKLNEDIEASEKDKDIKKKLQALASANLEELEEDAEKEKAAIKEAVSEEYNSQIKELEKTIEKLNEEVKERDEQIEVLTNSIVSKANEADLLKEIENLKQEITALKEEKKEEPKEETKEVIENKVDINSSEVQAIIAQGDILLRIKLLNERIAEKDAQIKLVEDELNNLTEKDIFATTFATQIKIIRDDRKESVVNANKKLVTISKNVKNAEVELNEKIVSRDKKKAELDEFDKKLSESKLTYLEKEEQLKIRAKLIAEYDSISVKVDEARENFIKQVKIYKKIIKEAELFVENCNKQESELIDLYLRKLREERSNENKDYNESKKERESMLQELERLTEIYEEMKSHNIINDEELPSVEEIDAMKKEYAKILGKLEMIKSRYQERSEVEDVLRTVDPEVSAYLKAFNEKESLELDNARKEEEMILATSDMRDSISDAIEKNNDRIAELDKVIKENEDNEKVVFYKQLIGSMQELKEKELLFKEKAEKLRIEIERIDFSDED
ncbi:MAG: hypothetical protein J5666_02420 [Bacilli bacterium]|nr:hypothetical protein [Bacilli bacterium]